MKKCSKCHLIKDEKEFSKNGSRKDGLSGNCKNCHTIYLKEHYRKNKQYYKEKAKESSKKYLEEYYEYKKTLVCNICGESRWWILEFHHLDINKKDINIGTYANDRTLKTLMKEIKKCIVLCANCHRDLHFKEK